jgi:RNA polymerase sigma factor (sigma-70 family)
MPKETQDIPSLVHAAQQGQEEAFSRLVQRFQDMAVGYAWTVLGDFHLAEDAAQDAFLEAHRCLPQLRQPWAWANWLRQIVFKHCDRRLRRARLATVQLDAVELDMVRLNPADNLAGDAATGDEHMEHQEIQEHVRQALMELPEKERQAVTLFYFSGHPQATIADFLGVSISTVKRYLSKARGSLHEQMMQWVTQSLEPQRPSRDGTYTRRVLQMVDAVSAGNIEQVAHLLQKDHDLLRAPGGRWGRPPLHRAADYGHQAVVELLLASGATISDTDGLDNATPLHWAAGSGKIGIVRLLVGLGADVNDCTDDHQAGPLGWACRFGQVQRKVVNYLLDQGATPDIFTAIALGDPAMVAKLVDGDVTVIEARMSHNEHCRTPLHFATDRRQLQIAAFLLKSGADPQARDAVGTPPLALLGGPKYPHDTALDAAAKKEWLDLFASYDTQPDLYAALALEDYQRANRLMPKAKPHEAEHVLHFVALGNLLRPLSWLLEHGVDASARAKVWGCTATPLHFAAEHGVIETARILLDAGADIEVRDDKFDATPLTWAEHCGQEEIANLIRQRNKT